MNVLVVNCGSSSLKFQLINSETEAVAAKGLCERIGIDGRLVYQPTGGEKEVTEAAMPTHTEAIKMVLDALVNPNTGVLKSLDEVEAIGHARYPYVIEAYYLISVYFCGKRSLLSHRHIAGSSCGNDDFSCSVRRWNFSNSSGT